MKNWHMNKKQKEEWAKVRAKGRKQYILVNGILIMGGTFAILGFVILQFIELLEAYWFNTPRVPINWTRDVFFAVFIGVCLGLTNGMGVWSAKERAYRESEDD